MKKIIAIIILSFICINVVNALEMDSGSGRTHCNYTSVQANLKHELVLDSGECPLMLYNESNNFREFDLKTEKITAGRNYYYLLDGYEMLFDEEADNYDGPYEIAVSYYKFEFDGQVYDYKLYIQNELTFSENFNTNTDASLSPTNNFSITDFTNPESGAFVPVDIVVGISQFTTEFLPGLVDIRYQFNLLKLNEDCESFDWCKKSTSYENYIIYSTNSNQTFIERKGYCTEPDIFGQQFTIDVKLKSNGTYVIFDDGNETIKTGSTLPLSIDYNGMTYEQCSVSNSSINTYQILNGSRFQNLICQVKWAALGVTSNVPTPTSSNIDFTCSTLNGQCTSDCEYQLEQNIGDVFSYCTNDIYTNYLKFNKIDSTNATARMNECIAFNNYYNQLINAGIINDFTENCGILSDEMEEKLTWILDIIKIVGPILALGLGTLDFVKVIVNGDADKEMKTAFKNFYTRLIAAALLFLIPFILAFLMDVFLTGKDGYDSDNPYCNIVDWGNNQ